MIFKVHDIKQEDKKIYKVDDPFVDMKVIGHKNSCLFCSHLTDIFYDYSNGPYMFYCDKDCYKDDISMFGKCKYFEYEEDNPHEVKDNISLVTMGTPINEPEYAVPEEALEDIIAKYVSEHFDDLFPLFPNELEIPKIKCDGLGSYSRLRKEGE